LTKYLKIKKELMKKKLKIIIIGIISLPLLYIIIGVSLYAIEGHIEANVHNVCVYNYTDDNIDITINNKKIYTTEGKTLLSDKILAKKRPYDHYLGNNLYIKGRIYNYEIKINGNTILEKEIRFPSDECGSFSARGGSITSVYINKDDDNNYDITFGGSDEWDSRLKKHVSKERWMDIFNFDGLKVIVIVYNKDI
jgi:hypothetical protein